MINIQSSLFTDPNSILAAIGAGSSEAEMPSPYTALVWAFLAALVLAIGISFVWALWRSPSKIDRLLRKKKLGLPELRDRVSLRGSDWLVGFIPAGFSSLSLAAACYYYLPKDSFIGHPLWLVIVNSWKTSTSLFSDYHPMPYGMLIAFLLGWYIGRLIGIGLGRRRGAKRVLISSRVHQPVEA